jgi:hypothetical protein
VDIIRVPLQNPDFASFLRRARDLSHVLSRSLPDVPPRSLSSSTAVMNH